MTQQSQSVQSRFEELKRLRDLSIEEFALEGGLADRWVREMGQRLKAAQLRKFYDMMKKIELKMRDREDDDVLATEHRAAILRLHVLLAYAVGRGTVPPQFQKVMRIMLDPQRMQTVGDYRNFIRFMEAVVAYHKLYEKLLEEQRRRRQ